MYQFPVALQQGENPLTGDIVLGFVHNDVLVFAPTLSSCGRFPVDPQAAYGVSTTVAEELTALNHLLRSAVDSLANQAEKLARRAVQIGANVPDSAELAGPSTDVCQAIGRAVAAAMLAHLGRPA